MFGIVVALKSEAKYLLEKLENKQQIFLTDKETYTGIIYGKQCVLSISGIGKVSAGLTTQMLIDKFNVDFIFNYGTCGGTNNNVEILKYYAIEKCCQFDFDLRDLDGVPLGYIQEYDSVYFKCQTKGLEFLNTTSIASADKFTHKACDVNDVNSMDCSLTDMEAGAIAQVCTSNSTPLFIIKGVSDVYGSQTVQEQFIKNLNTVATGFTAIIERAIKEIYLKNQF